MANGRTRKWENSEEGKAWKRNTSKVINKIIKTRC